MVTLEVRNHWIGPVLVFALAVVSATASLASDARRLAFGKHLAAECTTCHRIDGVDNGIPSITGWGAAEFADTMKFYRDGARANPAMKSVADSLDDEQVAALAAYFETLPKPARKK